MSIRQTLASRETPEVRRWRKCPACKFSTWSIEVVEPAVTGIPASGPALLECEGCLMVTGLTVQLSR